jgi:hypothetical protein
MMNTKILTSLSLGILFFASFASAVVSLSASPATLDFTENNQQLTFTLNNENADAINLTYSTLTAITQGTASATFSLVTPPTTLGGTSSSTLNAKLNGNPNDFTFGEYSRTLTITGKNQADSTDTDTQDLKLNFVSSFCKSGAIVFFEDDDNSITLDDLDINVDISNRDGKDDEWELLDVIEVEVEVENNNNNDDFEDVMIELGLFDSDGKNVADDLDFDSADDEEVDIGDIRDDDEDMTTFVFKIPADFDDGNYKLAVKAYSDKEGENNVCIDFSDDLSNDFFEAITIDRENDDDNFIVIDEDQIVVPSEVTCGETVSVGLEVFNIGDGGEEEQVLVEMFSDDLPITNQEFEIKQDLDEGDDERVQFIFDVPDGIEDKTYTLKFRTRYDYKRGSYRQLSRDTWIAPLKVIGCKFSGGGPTMKSNIVITATLGSDAKAGQELIVNSVITNAGSESATLVVDALGYQSWSELKSISERSFTLDSGKSQNVVFTFDVDEDTEGTESFTIEVSSNGELESRQVEVNIEGSEARGSGLTGFSIFNGGASGNNLIWIIAIVNIILIILIILVAVRLSRR